MSEPQLIPVDALVAARRHKDTAHTISYYERTADRDEGFRLRWDRDTALLVGQWRFRSRYPYTSDEAMADWGSWFLFDANGHTLESGVVEA